MNIAVCNSVQHVDHVVCYLISRCFDIIRTEKLLFLPVCILYFVAVQNSDENNHATFSCTRIA